jgi:ribosome-associated protein
LARRPKLIAKKVTKFVLSKKAEDVQLFDLRKITTMTDFFVICTGTSDVQVRAIADAVIEGCKKADITIYHVEGYESASWLLIDLVDIVVHIFRPDTRRYYQLERLWGDAIIEHMDHESEQALR